MNIAQLRQTFKTYIAAHLRIDEWGLDMPANTSNDLSPPSIALDEPAKFDESGYFQGQGSPTPLTVRATFPFQFLYRFNSIYRYEQLPRGELEAKLLELRTLLRQGLLCNLDEVLPESFKTTGSVAIARQENKDWIIVCKLTIECELLCEQEDIQLADSRFGGGSPDDPANPYPPAVPNDPTPVLRSSAIGVTVQGHRAVLDTINPAAFATAAQGALADSALQLGNLGYNHTQATPSNAWTINHNLHHKPSITVFFEGSTIEGTPIHNSDDVAVVTFATAITGTAHCI